MKRLDDKRCKGKIRHDQAEILTSLVCAMVMGKTSLRRQVRWIQMNEKWLRKQKRMALTNGAPSLATVDRILCSIDAEQFQLEFAMWAYEVECFYAKEKVGDSMKQIAIDGKALCGAGSNVIPNSPTPVILNAYSVSTGLVLAQYPIEEKSCELNELPDILDLLDVRDCMVSIDAIATHIGLMVKIINSGGHFIFQVKANQKSAMEDINRVFCEYENNKIDFDVWETGPEKNRDRIEYRKVRSSDRLQDLQSMENWPIGCFSLIETLRIMIIRDENENNITPSKEEFLNSGSKRQPNAEPSDKKESEYQRIGLVSDINLNAETLAGYKRGHWSIENKLHHVLDVTLGEDRSTARKSAVVLALLRKFAYNILMMAESDLKIDFKSMGEEIDYLEGNRSLFAGYVFRGIRAG